MNSCDLYLRVPITLLTNACDVYYVLSFMIKSESAGKLLFNEQEVSIVLFTKAAAEKL